MTELPAKLDGLERTWRRAGVPVDETFAPGSPAEATLGRLSALALPAPAEVLEWFEWHDGGTAPVSRAVLGPSNWNAVSLDWALSERENRLQGAVVASAEDGAEPPSYWWQPSWLPIAWAGGAQVIAADLADSETVAVRVIDWEDVDDSQIVRAESISGLVDLWTSLIEGGSWTWSAEAGRWVGEYTALPVSVTVSGLM